VSGLDIWRPSKQRFFVLVLYILRLLRTDFSGCTTLSGFTMFHMSLGAEYPSEFNTENNNNNNIWFCYAAMSLQHEVLIYTSAVHCVHTNDREGSSGTMWRLE
jgi:hypothetical protein